MTPLLLYMWLCDAVFYEALSGRLTVAPEEAAAGDAEDDVDAADDSHEADETDAIGETGETESRP